MQKSGFPKMRQYVRFSRIMSHMYLLLFMYLQLFNITKTGVYLVIIYVSTTAQNFTLDCEYFSVFSHIFQCLCTYMCISLYLAIYLSVYVHICVFQCI